MIINDLELAEVLCAKLCHDIAGPIGAINNSVDFLSEDNKEIKEKAMSLLKEGAFEAVARLKFFRQAYGVSYPSNNIKNEEMIKIIDDFFSTSKVKLFWEERNNITLGELNHKLSRLIINSIIIINNSLIYGGEIQIAITRNNDNSINATIIGTSASVKIEEDVINFLDGRVITKITTRNILGFFVRKLSDDIKADLKISYNETELKFNIFYDR